MNISKKWHLAAAGVLTLALVSGGAVSANAATGDVLNPQSNGSKGSFFLYDANTGDFADAVPGQTPTRVYTRSTALIGSASATDVLAEINPAATRPVTGATPYTQVKRFISDRTTADRDGGVNTWNAHTVDADAGPNGGTLVPDMSLDSFGPQVGNVIAAGGAYWYGIAYTTNNGVTVIGTVYREITIEAGTGNYTVGPVQVEAPPAVVPPVEADLTAPLQDTDLVTETLDSTTLAIDAGVAAAGQTLTYGSFPAGLSGQVVLNGSGVGTINAAAIPVGQATKLWLSQSDYTGLMWDSFTLTVTPPLYDLDFTSNLTAEVTTSNRFELVAPAIANVNLGQVRRDKTTTAVKLGQFSVFDDRDVLKGWNLNVTASDFTKSGGGATIDKNALGYLGLPVGGIQTGVTLTSGKVAGAGAFGTIATAATDYSSAEEGATFDADLTFKAPSNAVKGVYNGTVTLTLVSK